MLATGLVARGLSSLIVVGGRQPVDAAVIAIVLGLLLRNAGLVPAFCLPGIKAFQKVLILGIVLLGAALDFATVGSQGFRILLVVLVTMSTAFMLIYLLARIFRLPVGLSSLLAVGTTVCGESAIAVTAPLIRAREEETAYAIGTVALWGLVAILLYPRIALLLGVGDFHFGVFAGTAIHSTPQVIAAGYIHSDAAGHTATAVKLVRNCFMVPVAFGVALWHARRTSVSGDTAALSSPAGHWAGVAGAFPWFLFGYFLMAGLSTAGYFSPEGVAAFTRAGKFLVLLGLAGIGLNTTLASFRDIGLRPLAVGLLGAGIVAAIAAGMIILLLS